MRHRTALYCYIFACVRSHRDAEDVLQNVSHVCPTVVNGRYRHVK